jgi:hypothetical protein
VFNSIVTGSVAYGRPEKNSDVDLVILCSPADLDRLAKYADSTFDLRQKPDSDPGSGAEKGLTASLRFGKLNVIVTTDLIAFGVWVEGTRELKSRAPVGREAAVAHFRELREKHGLRAKKE